MWPATPQPPAEHDRPLESWIDELTRSSTIAGPGTVANQRSARSPWDGSAGSVLRLRAQQARVRTLDTKRLMQALSRQQITVRRGDEPWSSVRGSCADSSDLLEIPYGR